MKDLSKIDLISVNCVNPEESVKALLYSSEQIKFGSIKILAHYRPSNLPAHIEYIQIEKQTHSTMNWFHLNTLPKYIDNEYMLSIHEDGFVINADKWDDDFLKYDYIGAPWPAGLEWCKRNRVGNGGFVLKSKKFLNLEETIPYTDAHNDVLVTNTYYDYFKQNGCKYAPVDVASRFSLEHAIPECEYNLNNTFGFHGKLHEEARNNIKKLERYEHKLKLPNVEIISINTHNPEQSVKAIEYSCKHITFASKKIFSDTVPQNLPADMIHVQVPKFTTREGYSDFTLKELYNYTDSEFVLMIHDDGFVINPHLWNSDFLKYDYIGAPWPGPTSDIEYGRVGNGGFCIRSRRLLDATRGLEYEPCNDDWIIGVTHNKILRDMDIHTAPVTLAMTFSLELPIAECDYNLENTFGFHSRRSQQHDDKINLIN